MTHKSLKSVVWLRRDLRITDNSALTKACCSSIEVIPFLNLDFLKIGNSRFDSWSLSAVESIKRDLMKRGSDLIVSRGEITLDLISVCKAFNATQVVWVKSLEPLENLSDINIQRKLKENGIQTDITENPDKAFVSHSEVYLTSYKRYSNSVSLTQIGKPNPIPDSLKPPLRWRNYGLGSSFGKALDDESQGGKRNVKPGSANQTIKKITAKRINHTFPLRPFLPDGNKGTEISTYLSHGQFSLREILCDLNKYSDQSDEDGISKLAKQLLWRGFAKSFMHHHPRLEYECKDSRFDKIKWDNSNELLEAWKTGVTGYPIVDAAMRQLSKEGWMPNRARLIAASFLVKQLLVTWRLGAEWFMKQLFDADKASNYFNWQWVTGCGINSNPYFRILNPTLQSKKFDPFGEYIKTWVPELSELNNQNIHTPWLCDTTTLSESCITLGKTYPHPIVEHMSAREAALKAYSTALKNDVT